MLEKNKLTSKKKRSHGKNFGKRTKQLHARLFKQKMTNMKKLILLTLLVCFAAEAHAKCFCACIGGRPQPICEGPFNIPPICPLMICP